ncbi:MAG TPA: hypothetical protein VK459_06825, partial [Polyangiaceae bacterium]|nr:hypothetical protein [Polyangiaceae bacterium]
MKKARTAAEIEAAAPLVNRSSASDPIIAHAAHPLACGAGGGGFGAAVTTGFGAAVTAGFGAA